MRWLLFPHILLGFTGLVLGPIQFSSRIRKNNLRLHRTLGKIYVAAILMASMLALIICLTYRPHDSTFKFTFENIIQSSVWFITTLVAWIAAKNKQTTLHKTWMSRSYGVTFIFVAARVLTPLHVLPRMDNDTFGVFLWFLIVLALIIPELLLNGREIFLIKKK